MSKHKHYDVIVAWAEGKQIQYRCVGENKWTDIPKRSGSSPIFYDSYLYRVKPKTVKVLYKRYLTIHNTICIENKISGYNPENSKLFKKWIDTEWQEHEVEDE